MATWSNLTLQNSNSPLMEQLIFFHDHTMMILIMITISITYIMIYLMINKLMNRFFLSGQMIEIIWTILPAIILLFIALPSLRLLYLLDETLNPLMTMKITGHQWYWSYEYTNFLNIEFDSYMVNNHNTLRLLNTDNFIIIPMNIQTRLLITAADVLHSWTIPSLGVKIDATPGRLNQTTILLNRPGIFYGQCSEICGMNHSFMPIKLESTSMKMFIMWIK